MAAFDKIRSLHSIGININPHNGDLAVVSINNVGAPGRLNLFVLKEYGYSNKDLPTEETLSYGFSSATDSNKKSIIFIVTVKDGNTRENLETNLFNALREFRGWFRGKKLWVPLMGTGDGGLTLAESYGIIVKAINSFQEMDFTECEMIISIPDTDEGRKLLHDINQPTSPISFDSHSFLKSFKNKFFLVGSFWGPGNDQTSRFIKDSIWENAREDEVYNDIINSIKPNDILIIKSTFQSDGVSYLKVRAFGIVVENLLDGTNLKVNWILTGLTEDFANLGHYRRTITTVSDSDVLTIFGRLNNDQRNLIAQSLNIKVTDSIAGVISDSDSGIDYLGIDKDIQAFARVIAAKSFEPPLAIALFGKWGSGKSFFMRKLKDHIRLLSSNPRGGIYCEGIAHIHFNAWSYMDCNLWASIVTKLFEELQEYISENRKEDIEKQVIEKELTSGLSITKEELSALESKKSVVNEQLRSLDEKRETIESELNEKMLQLNKNTLWETLQTIDSQFNVGSKIEESFEKNQSFVTTKNELKQIVPEKYWSDPGKAFEIANSRITFIRQFFSKGEWKWNLFWLVIILLVVLTVPLLLVFLDIQIQALDFILPQVIISGLTFIGVIWRQTEKVYKKLQPVVASFWKIKEQHEKARQQAKLNFEQHEKTLKLEIEKKRAESLLIQDQIQKTQTIKTDLEYRIKNAFATEALYSFINKRSTSEEYKKHLGIISLIRRDLEILSSLFSEHNQEAEKIKEAEEFRKKFKKPLERIVLYIDDLDRCPEENVVQVLEAVSLLMAFPLFVVVVGVDSRWIKNALVKRHSVQFTKGLMTDHAATEILDPSNYLEKIFQVAFHLKSTEDVSVKNMIRSLAKSRPIMPNPPQFDVEPTKVSDEEAEAKHIIKNTVTSPSVTSLNAQSAPQALEFTEDEIAFMEDLSEIVGPNPRAIKRFVNTYRIIKAHQEYQFDPNRLTEVTGTLLLLALSLGHFKNLSTSINSFMETHSSNDVTMSVYFQKDQNSKDNESDRERLRSLLTGKKFFDSFRELNVQLLINQNALTRRFSFENI